MAEEDLIRLIESQSAELAGLRAVLETHVTATKDGFQTLNWKLDRLVEVVDDMSHRVDSLHNREMINEKRLSKLEHDVSAIKHDVAAIKAKLAGG